MITLIFFPTELHILTKCLRKLLLGKICSCCFKHTLASEEGITKNSSILGIVGVKRLCSFPHTKSEVDSYGEENIFILTFITFKPKYPT